MKLTTALFVFSLLALLAKGQQSKDTIPRVHFQLVDATNGRPVSLGHVVSTKKKMGIVTDMQGFFSLPVERGDTIVVSALGYHQMRIPSWGQFQPDSLYYPIRLTPRSYEIREVRITRFGSYQRFIREVASMEFPKSETEELQERLEEYIRKHITNMELKSTPSPAGGIIFGKDWLAIQMEKVEERRIEDQKWGIIFRKFSARTVRDLTGLDGVDAIMFMEFCDFTEGFLLLASDYEIQQRILEKYEVYKYKMGIINNN